MKNLFKYASEHWKALLAIVAILIVQAYCDLSLPAYTSDIVNVGIQQGGVEDHIPDAISAEDMETLLLFTSEKDGKTVLSAYEKDDKTYEEQAYVLKDTVKEDTDRTEKLSGILAAPMMMAAGFESGSDMTADIEEQLKAQLPPEMISEDMTVLDILKMMPQEQKQAFVSEIEKKTEELPDTITEQAAVNYVKEAYADLGIDMDELQFRYLFSTGAKMIGLAFLGMAASVLVGFLASRVGAAAGRDLRGRVFKKVVGYSSNEFDHFSTASLITRSTNDIQQVQFIIVMLLRIVLYAPILAIGGIVQVFQTNVSMSWIIGLAVVLIALVVLVLFAVAMPKFKSLQKLVDKVNLVMREILTGLPVIRAFSTEKHEEERFDDANRTLTKTNLFVNRAMTFMMPVMMLIMYSLTILIVWVGSHRIDGGSMQVGSMTAFITYAMMIVMSFLMLTMMSVMLPRGSVAAKRIDEVLQTKTSVQETAQPKHLQDSKGVLTFDHVCFRYKADGRDVLSDINLNIRSGETIGIIGGTGSAKSSLVQLLPRLYDVTEGSVTIGGVDVRRYDLDTLRNNVAMVLQKNELFSGTIAENLRWGNPDATDAEIEDACKQACADEFIERFPDKYQTHIEQGGNNVSGGQKQRLCIARALLKKPRILILDDSTSAVDTATDAKIRHSFAEKIPGTTVFIIAQRISSVENADKVLVLDNGRVSGFDTPANLLKTNAIYQDVYNSQTKGSGDFDEKGGEA